MNETTRIVLRELRYLHSALVDVVEAAVGLIRFLARGILWVWIAIGFAFLVIATFPGCGWM